MPGYKTWRLERVSTKEVSFRKGPILNWQDFPNYTRYQPTSPILAQAQLDSFSSPLRFGQNNTVYGQFGPAGGYVNNIYVPVADVNRALLVAYVGATSCSMWTQRIDNAAAIALSSGTLYFDHHTIGIGSSSLSKSLDTSQATTSVVRDSFILPNYGSTGYFGVHSDADAHATGYIFSVYQPPPAGSGVTTPLSTGLVGAQGSSIGSIADLSSPTFSYASLPYTPHTPTAWVRLSSTVAVGFVGHWAYRITLSGNTPVSIDYKLMQNYNSGDVYQVAQAIAPITNTKWDGVPSYSSGTIYAYMPSRLSIRWSVRLNSTQALVCYQDTNSSPYAQWVVRITVTGSSILAEQVADFPFVAFSTNHPDLAWCRQQRDGSWLSGGENPPRRLFRFSAAGLYLGETLTDMPWSMYVYQGETTTGTYLHASAESTSNDLKTGIDTVAASMSYGLASDTAVDSAVLVKAGAPYFDLVDQSGSGWSANVKDSFVGCWPSTVVSSTQSSNTSMGYVTGWYYGNRTTYRSVIGSRTDAFLEFVTQVAMPSGGIGSSTYQSVNRVTDVFLMRLGPPAIASPTVTYRVRASTTAWATSDSFPYTQNPSTLLDSVTATLDSSSYGEREFVLRMSGPLSQINGPVVSASSYAGFEDFAQFNLGPNSPNYGNLAYVDWANFFPYNSNNSTVKFSRRLSSPDIRVVGGDVVRVDLHGTGWRTNTATFSLVFLNDSEQYLGRRVTSFLQGLESESRIVAIAPSGATRCRLFQYTGGISYSGSFGCQIVAHFYLYGQGGPPKFYQFFNGGSLGPEASNQPMRITKRAQNGVISSRSTNGREYICATTDDSNNYYGCYITTTSLNFDKNGVLFKSLPFATAAASGSVPEYGSTDPKIPIQMIYYNGALRCVTGGFFRMDVPLDGSAPSYPFTEPAYANTAGYFDTRAGQIGIGRQNGEYVYDPGYTRGFFIKSLDVGSGLVSGTFNVLSVNVNARLDRFDTFLEPDPTKQTYYRSSPYLAVRNYWWSSASRPNTRLVSAWALPQPLYPSRLRQPHQNDAHRMTTNNSTVSSIRQGPNGAYQ